MVGERSRQAIALNISFISPALCERATRGTCGHTSRRRADPQGTCGAHWRSASDRGCLPRRRFVSVMGTYFSMLDSIRFSCAFSLVLFAVRASVSPGGPGVTGFQAHRERVVSQDLCRNLLERDASFGSQPSDLAAPAPLYSTGSWGILLPSRLGGVARRLRVGLSAPTSVALFFVSLCL